MKVLLLLFTSCTPQSTGALPEFRASAVLVADDTAWFFPDSMAEGAILVPAVVYARRSGQWATMQLNWREADRRRRLPGRSGSYPGRLDMALSEDFRLAYSGERVDPTHAQSPDSAEHVMPLVTLNGAGVDAIIALQLPEEVRRTLYLRAGGELDSSGFAPPFNSLPQRWAVGEGMLAFAMPAVSPPQQDAPWLPMRDEDTAYDPFLSGVALFDVTRQRMEPIAHERFIEHAWTGMSFTGGALWLAPSMVPGSDVDWTDPPARRMPPPLARYDLASRTWLFVEADDLPLQLPLRSMSGDSTHLYLVSANGIATLDTRNMRWDARYYTDSTYILADGADTTVTLLGATPRDMRGGRTETYGERIIRLAEHFEPRLPGDTVAALARADSLAVLEPFAAELEVRHHTAFVHDLLRFAPYDSVSEIVFMMGALRGGRWDMGEPYVDHLAAAAILQPPEFRRYLREAMWKLGTQRFAFEALRPSGPEALRSAARATLDSGSFAAAAIAADSLRQWGDPAGLTWIRKQVENPEMLLASQHSGLNYPLQVVRSFADDMVARGDTTGLSVLMRLLDAAPATMTSELLRVIVNRRGDGWEARIGRAIESRPLLWGLWLYRIGEDSMLVAGNEARAIASRVASGILALGDSLALEAWYLLYPHSPPQSAVEAKRSTAWHRTAATMSVATWLDPSVLVPAIVSSASRDTAQLNWKNMVLVRLTGNDAAPYSPKNEDEYRALQRYWVEWWREHRATFVPPTREEGQAASRRWSERFPTRRR